MSMRLRHAARLVGLLVVAYVCVSGCCCMVPVGDSSGGGLGGKPAAAPRGQPVKSYEVSDLAAEFEANAVAAESRWKGQWLSVTGEVRSVNTTILDRPFVSLGKPGSLFGRDVHCTFPNKNDVMSFSKGQTLTVVGRCDGYSIGSVMLGDCYVP